MGIAPLLRPESIIISFIAFIYSFIYPASDFKRLKNMNNIMARSIFLLIAITPVALWMTYAFIEFGKILPNTNAAKKIQGGIDETFLRMIQVYLLGFGVPLVIIALAPLFKTFCRDSSKTRVNSTLFSRDACILAICWIVLLSVFYLLNKTNVQTRYALLIGPLFIIFSILILYEYSTSARGKLLFNLGLISMVLANVLLFAVSVAPHLLNKVKTVDQVRQLTSFINAEIPENEPIAVYAIGQIGFETKNPIIDTGGITMPEVVQFLGSEEKVKNWAIAKGAKYFIGNSQHRFNQIFEREGYFLGWTLNPNAYRKTHAVYLYRIN